MDRLVAFPQTWRQPPVGRVLVLAPHADDECIGCGGVLALHRRQGDEVAVAVATDGAAGDPERRFDGPSYEERRRAESIAAGRILGLREPEFWEYPDGKLHQADGVAQRVLQALDAWQPSIVYHPSETEMHRDHHALAVAFREAMAMWRGNAVAYAYEIWVPVVPTHVIDITSVWSLKEAALAQYETQLAYNDYLRAIRGLNAYRSIYLPSAQFVEAFAQNLT